MRFKKEKRNIIVSKREIGKFSTGKVGYCMHYILNLVTKGNHAIGECHFIIKNVFFK